MNSKTGSTLVLRTSTCLFLAGLVLFTVSCALAQDDVSISAEEFHRRSPQAGPVALAGVLQQAPERFRTNARAYLCSTEARDEILAVYLEALYQIPAQTNFNPATLLPSLKGVI